MSTEVEHYKGSLKHLVFNTIRALIKGGSLSSAKKSKWVSTWYGPIAYEYSGGNETINHPAQEMPKEFAEIARQLEEDLGHPKGYFNSALMNVFPEGVGIGKHADDELIYGADDQEQTIGAVATVSLGGISVVKITSNDGKKQWNLKVEDGDVYIMPGGNFQRKHKHEVGKSSAPRISMTFRHVPKNRIPKGEESKDQAILEAILKDNKLSFPEIPKIWNKIELHHATRLLEEYSKPAFFPDDEIQWHPTKEDQEKYDYILKILPGLYEESWNTPEAKGLDPSILTRRDTRDLIFTMRRLAGAVTKLELAEEGYQLDIARIRWKALYDVLTARKEEVDKLFEKRKKKEKGWGDIDIRPEDEISDEVIESFSKDYDTAVEVAKKEAHKRDPDAARLGLLSPQLIKSFITTDVAIQWLIDNTTGPIYKKIAQRIQKSIPAFEIQYFEDTYVPGQGTARGAAFWGYIDLETGERIDGYVSIASSGLTEEVLLHELIHIAVGYKFTHPYTLKEKAAKSKLEEIAGVLQTILDKGELPPELLGKQGRGRTNQLTARENWLVQLMRGIEDPAETYDPKTMGPRIDKVWSERSIEELITYALTNKTAQALLKSLPAIGEVDVSLWSQFTKAIRQLLGLENTTEYPPSLLDQILESTDALLKAEETKPPVGPVGRKKGTLTKQQIEKLQEEERTLRLQEEARYISTASLSKQALYVLFPEIITKDGALAEDSVLAKHFDVLRSLATVLGLKSPERKDMEAALKALPDNKDFIETTVDTLEPAITEDQLKKAKTEATEAEQKKLRGTGKKAESVARKIAKNLENIFGILGKYANELINIRKKLDKKSLNGIHTLPDEVFRGITDSSGRKQYKSLERALVALGTSEETAIEMAQEYSRYERKYRAVYIDGRIPKGNTAINKPLSILYSRKETEKADLPPQLLFGMMLGTLNWLQQNPNNIRFRDDYARQEFLYGGHAKLSPNEKNQLLNIGHSYIDATSHVGNDIAKILKISGLEADIYYNNLVPALGALALQIEYGPFNETDTDSRKSKKDVTPFEEDKSRFRIEIKKWKFARAVKDDRNFNNTDISKYKHIRLNLKKDKNGKELSRKTTKEELAAKKDMLAVIDAGVDTDADRPAQTPFTKIVDQIKNSLGGVPSANKFVLGLLQRTSWTGTQALDIAAKLDKAGHRETLYELAGKQHVDDSYHIVKQESIKSSNADKTNAIDGLFDAYNNEEGNLLEKFYFKYKLQNQHRIMMQSSGTVNPQASGVDRYFVRPTKASVKYNESKLWKFKLSVVGNLGFKIDKNDLTAALDAFDYLIADEAILEAVNAIQNIDEKGQPAKLAKLLLVIKNKEVLGEADHGSSILNGLTGLAQGLTIDTTVTEAGEVLNGTLKTTFESDVVLEIDGISSGFAQNVFQFPMYGADNELRRNQVGVYTGFTEVSTRHNTYNPDVYEDVGAKVEEYSGVDTASRYHLDKGKKGIFDHELYEKRNAALSELYPTLKNGEMRKFIKYPFLIFMYGGGPKSISEGIAGDIVDELYTQLDSHQRHYNSLRTKEGKERYITEEIKPFLNNLVTIGAIKNAATLETAIKSKDGSKEVMLSELVAIPRIAEILVPRLELALMDMLGGTKDARDAAIQAGEILHAVFMAHFEKAKEIAETDTPAVIDKKTGKVLEEAIKRPPLTEKEIDLLIKDQLIEMFPQYRGPLMQTDQSFIDLTKRERTETTSTGERITVDYYNIEKGGKSSSETSPRSMTFAPPGVSTLIRMIINMDASILTQTLKENPHVLMLHDAVMGDPDTLELSEKSYNKWYIKFNQKYSVLGAITKQMQKVIDETIAIDTKNNNTDLMSAVDKWIKNEAWINQRKPYNKRRHRTELVQDVVSMNTLVEQTRADEFKEMSQQGGIVSHQLYMAKKAVFEATEIILDKERNLRLKLSNLIDLLFEGVPEDVRHKPTVFDIEQKKIEEDFKKEIKEQREKGLLHSLPDQRRDNPIDILVGDITKGNVMSFFGDMKEHSEGYYYTDQEQNDHASELKKVLSIIADGMNDSASVRFTLEEVDGITQGDFDPYSNRIRVSLSRQGPLSLNNASPQEAYVHETLHAIVNAALANNPLLKRRIEKLYRQTKQDLAANGGYEVFLQSIRGGVKNASKEDKRTAKEQYDYLFNFPENEKYKLDEFLAYAVTNRDLVKYLSSTKTKIQFKYRKEERLFTRAIDVFRYFIELAVDTTLRTFGKRGGFGADAHHEMLAVLESLLIIQNKHRNIYQLLQDKTYNAVDASDQFFRRFAEEKTLEIVTSEPTNRLKRLARVAVGTGYNVLSKNAFTLKARQAVYETMNGTLRGIATEIGEGILGKRLIQQLLYSKVNISKARQDSERFTVKWFNEIWKSVDATKPKGMSVDLRENLTNVIFRTDLSSLFHMGFSHAKIASFIGNKKKIKGELKSLEKQILRKKAVKRKHISHAVDYAKELGEYMASGDTYLNVPHMNTFTIASRILANPTAADRALLDAYATLTALDKTKYNEATAVKELVDAEFATDPNENGFIDLLDGHIEYVIKSKEDLFDDNSTQMVKGYIVERTDNLTDMKAGTADQKSIMAAEGYHEPYSLGSIPGITRVNDTLFIGRNAPPIPYVSAIMSTTNKRNIGTTLTEILGEDTNYQISPGVPDIAKIKQAIRDIDKEQQRQATRKKLKVDSDLRLRPVLDEKDNIVDYRVIMNHVTRKKLLDPDLEIQNVFAHMQSSYIDRKNTIKNDKRTVELLVYEQKERMPSHPKEFIDLLDPANGFIDRYYRLPKEVRMYIDRFTKNGTFMVRKDVINKVFGYQAKDFRNLAWLQHPSMRHIKRWAGLSHYILREVVGYGKDRIVIAMPQVWLYNAYSNIAQLTMRNIPIAYTAHKMIEGFHEYQAYHQDTEERAKLRQRIAIKKITDEGSDEHRQLAAINIRIENNRIHNMSQAGLDSLIVEDLNDASLDGYINKGRRLLRTSKWFNQSNKVPTAIHAVAANIFMTKSTGPYQFMRQFVQMTDFLGRYVMIQHAMEVRGLDFDTAMHEALDAFVLFDEALAPALEALDATGGTVFLSYFLRNQRASRQLAMRNPTGVALSGAFQYSTGIPTLGNVDSSFLAGDLSPTVMYLDELFDEANNPTGFDLLVQAFGDIFN